MLIAVMVRGDLFHGLHRGAMRSSQRGVNERGCNRNAKVQSKPHQHEAGDVVSVAQMLHL